MNKLTKVGQLWKSDRDQSLRNGKGTWVDIQKGDLILILSEPLPPFQVYVDVLHVGSHQKLMVDIYLFGVQKRFDKVSEAG